MSDINIKFNCLHLINSLILFSEASITRTFPNSNLSLKLFHPRIARPSFYTRQARGTHEHRAPINFPFINKLLRSDKSRVEITKSSRVSSVARDPAPPPCALYRKFNPCCRQASSFKLESCDDSPCEKQVNRFIRFRKVQSPLAQWKKFLPTFSLNLFDQNNLLRYLLSSIR